MARRQQVFQSKVLQKLYPAAASQREVEEPRPPSIVETLAQKICPKRNTSGGDGGVVAETERAAAHLGRRLYTVLPPPALPPHPHPEDINRSGDPADSSAEPDPDGEEEEEDEDEEVGHGRRRRKRRRKASAAQQQQQQQQQGEGHPEDTGGEATVASEPSETQGGDKDGLSRNKRRKLKKKRHKERLLASGLVPRAAALEFTYQREGAKEEGEEKEEEEGEERRAAEVTDFLRTTMETYVSDGRRSLTPGAMEDLLSRMSSGRAPPSVLGQLQQLKALVQQQDTDRLAEALDQLNASSSSLSAEETAAVVGLFQYWITDILPMQTRRQRHTEACPHQPD